MLEVIGFILTYTAKFITMLFSIPVGGGLTLGFMFCLCFIVLPIIHRVVCFLKRDAMEEIADGRSEQIKQRRKGGK